MPLANRRAVIFFLLPLVLFPAFVDGASCRFRAIFNFGDSNSDTGGFWAAFPAQHGPFGLTFFKRPAGRASDGRLVIDFLAQAIGLPFLSPYLQSIGSSFEHGANFATLASTVLMPNTSLFVSGISPFYLAVQLNQMKDFRDRVLQVSSEGFSYSTRACCGYGGGDYNFDPGLFCGNSKEINGRTVTALACPYPERYVSWDGIHASEAANKLLTVTILNGSYFYPTFPLSELCDLQPIG